MRWQTGEVRNAVFWLSKDDGTPATALTPTVLGAFKVSDGSTVATGAVVELGNGLYRFSFTATAAGGYAFVIDAGATVTTGRYVPMEVPVGGYVDNIDATVSSRAAASVLATDYTALSALLTALGAPAQASVLATDYAALLAAIGTPAQAAALASDLTALLAEIDTRATPADVHVTVTAPATSRGEVS